MLTLTQNKFNPDNYWRNPIKPYTTFESTDVANFDQNGYDLSLVEQAYARSEGIKLKLIRDRVALFDEWMTASPKVAGSIVNHCYLFHRREFKAEALEQLKSMATHRPILFKPLKLRAKWGLDVSIDYVDYEGNVLEVLHWEWDSFNLNQIEQIKLIVEDKLINVDWEHAAKQLIKRKDEWYNMGFFEQSDWKSNYFGIPQEQFKMVSWQ
jgi:hypothetical protein